MLRLCEGAKLLGKLEERHQFRPRRAVPCHGAYLYDARMSAMGQKRTSRNDRVTTVLSLKADIRKREWHVRLVPIPNIARVPILLFQRSFVSRTQLCPSFFQFSLTINLVALSL